MVTLQRVGSLAVAGLEATPEFDGVDQQDTDADREFESVGDTNGLRVSIAHGESAGHDWAVAGEGCEPEGKQDAEGRG
jgi:hypothetical protein